jgi:hypothetical protein
MTMTTFLSNRAIYETVIRDTMPQTRERLWIATADIKDMYVETGGRDMVPFLAVLDGLLKRGVEIRLIHAKDPRTELARGLRPLSGPYHSAVNCGMVSTFPQLTAEWY